jgi:hypothetical protein
MPKDRLRKELTELMNDDVTDPRDLYSRLHRKLAQMKALDIEIPKEVLNFQHQIEVELIAESQGR